MRRADRLFALIQTLRGGRLRTAASLAETLECSARTVYRDIADLVAHGVPIDGERGVGYLLRDAYFLPPLALTSDEIEALRWGVGFVQTHGDARLAAAAQELLVKIRGAAETSGPGMFAKTDAVAAKPVLEAVRRAIRGRRVLSFGYTDLAGRSGRRTVRPLSLEFWGACWTLTAWCELRGDFRVFRCDRLTDCEIGERRFAEEPGRRQSDYLEGLKAK